MEADWDELSRVPVPPPGPHALPTVATTVAFDDVMELLWVGNEFVSFAFALFWEAKGHQAWVLIVLSGRVELCLSMDPNSKGIRLSGPILFPKGWYDKLYSMRGG